MLSIARLILLTVLSYLSVAIVCAGSAFSEQPGNGQQADAKEPVSLVPYRLKTESEIVKWTKWWTASDIQHIDYDGETILVINIQHGSGYTQFFVSIYRFVDNEWALCFRKKVDTYYEAALDETRQWLVLRSTWEKYDIPPMDNMNLEQIKLRIDSLKPLPIPKGYRWPPKLEGTELPW